MNYTRTGALAALILGLPLTLGAEQRVRKNPVGLSYGLAVSSTTGGFVIPIRVELKPGKGKLIVKGNPDAIFRKSIDTAFEYTKNHAQEFGIENDKFTRYDLIVHVPGSLSGCSAGIALFTAIVSVYTGRQISGSYAMTGAIGSRGEVTAIGDLQKKVAGAKKGGIVHVIAPRQNAHDVARAHKLLKNMEITFIRNVNELLNLVLLPAPIAYS